MAKERGEEERGGRRRGKIKPKKGKAGAPESMDPATARRRAEGTGMLTSEELEERQKKMRTTRRKGGPDLDERTKEREEAGEGAPPEAPPTEAGEPEE